MRAWEGLFDELKELLPELVAAYSAEHYAGIQAANRKVWPKYREAGTEVTRLSEEDVVRFREVAIPKWFEWANKDAGAARLFQIHLDVMQDPEVGWSIQARSRAIRSTSEAAAIPSHMAGRGPAVPVLPSRRIVPRAAVAGAWKASIMSLEFNFVLPHLIYWGGLFAFPLAYMLILKLGLIGAGRSPEPEAETHPTTEDLEAGEGG